MGFAAQQRGQAAVELIAAVPILLAVLLLVAQLAVAGHALWSAGDAARAGARAVLIGADAEDAARRALPFWLDGAAEVESGDGAAVEVRVGAPALIPGVPSIPVEAAAALDPQAVGDDG
jgi:hypothetical protein